MLRRPWSRLSSSLVMSVACLLFVAEAVAPVNAQEVTPELFSQLRYRHIGPGGNRTSAVVGAPGDPMVYYIGAASGGVWKSDDAGLNWRPVFDDQSAQSIGALAIAPSDHNVVWAGTGEAFIRSNVSLGNGVYKSTDAGKSWQHMGLEDSGRIGRVWIDPRDPDIVLVGALGHCYGPQDERGVFRTTDGGKTWAHVLFADEDTGCFEIAVNPSNPRIMFAGMWPLEIHTYGRESGGPKGGIYRSTDGGITLEAPEGRGLPEAPIGKVGVAIAQSNPDVVYALMETGSPNRGVLWRSSNSGDSWTCVSHDRILNERPHYASRIMVNPADEDEVYFAANSHSITYDGGQTTERLGLERRRARHVGRPAQSRPDDDQRRRRRADHAEPRRLLEPHRSPHRADVPRGRRQPDPLLRLWREAGRLGLQGAEHERRTLLHGVGIDGRQ